MGAPVKNRHQVYQSGRMFNLSKRTDGNEKYHLLSVAWSDYVVARIAMLNWCHTTAHQLISQAIEKYIKLFITVTVDSLPKKDNNHKLTCLLEKYRDDITLFNEILADADYMELINELNASKFIATRYGENYLSCEFPKLLDTLDSLMKRFMECLPNGPKRGCVHRGIVGGFLYQNKFFSADDINVIRL